MKTFFLSLLLCLCSCTFIQERLGRVVTKPKLTLNKVQLAGISVSKLDLLVDVTVENPNSFEISFKELKYQLTINQDPMAAGSLPGNTKIPAQQTAQVQLPLTVETMKLRSLLQDLMFRRSELISKWQVDATFDTPLGGIAVSLSDEKPILR